MVKVENLRKPILLVIALLIVCIVAVRPAKAQLTNISIYPPVVDDVELDQTFQINVTVDIGADQLFMWVLSLQWDPSKIDLVGDPIEGLFLKKLTSTFFTWSEINHTGGYIRELVCTSLTDKTGTGSGVIATMNFIALNLDGSVLDLRGPALADPAPIWIDADGFEYPFEVVTDGSVTVIPELPTFMVAPLLMSTTLLAVIITKTSWLRRRRDHPLV